MVKKGQVTAFVIVSIVVLLIVAGVIYTQWDYLEDNLFSNLGWFQDVPEEVKPIHDHVINCMKETSEIILPYNAWQSGFYDLGKNVNPYNTTYYLYKGTNIMPSKLFLEKELAKGMEKNIEYCLDFESFEEFNIKVGDISYDVDIKDQSIIYDMDYRLEISKGEEVFVLEDYRYVMNIRFGEMFEAVQESVDLLQEDVNDICLSCLVDIGEDYNLSVEFYNPLDYEVEYVFIAEDIVFDNRALMFTYAVRYIE